MRLAAGLRPEPLGELKGSPDPLAPIRGPTSKGRGREGREGEEGREGRERGREGEGGERERGKGLSPPPQKKKFLAPPLDFTVLQV